MEKIFFDEQTNMSLLVFSGVILHLPQIDYELVVLFYMDR